MSTMPITSTSMLTKLPYFSDAVSDDISAASEEKGTLCVELPQEEQIDRVFSIFAEIHQQYRDGEISSIPWDSVGGYALIGWVRQNYDVDKSE